MRSQSYAKNCKRLRTSRSRRNTISKGRAHQLLVQCQWSALKTYRQIALQRLNRLYLGIYTYMDIHVCNMYILIWIYIYTITISEKKKEAWIWGTVWEGMWDGLEGVQGREKCCSCIIISRIKKKKTKNILVFSINFHRERKQAGWIMPERSAFSV